MIWRTNTNANAGSVLCCAQHTQCKIIQTDFNVHFTNIQLLCYSNVTLLSRCYDYPELTHTHTHTQIELKWKAFHVFLTKLNCTWLQHVLLFSSTTIFAHVTTAFAPCPGLAVSALLCSFVLSHVLFSIRINIFRNNNIVQNLNYNSMASNFLKLWKTKLTETISYFSKIRELTRTYSEVSLNTSPTILCILKMFQFDRGGRAFLMQNEFTKYWAKSS